MTPGDYHVYCIGSWGDKPYDYNLTVHCYQIVELKKVYCQNNFPNIITESLTNVNLSEGKRASKGNVDEYILYHEPSNLVLVTATSLVDKEYKYSQNFQQVKLDQLSLINTVHPEDNFRLKRGY